MHWTSELPVTGTSGRNRRRPVATTQLVAVAAVAVLGGATAAAFVAASPTGWRLADAAERAIFVALCALAGSRARRWTFLWAGAVGVVFGGAVARGLGLFALAGAGLLFALHRRHRVVGAALGAASGIAALNLQWPAVATLTALLAAAAVIPLWSSGARNCRRRARRWIFAGLGVAALTAMVGTIVTVTFGLQQRTAIADAVARTRSAVGSVGDEAPDQVRARFAAASAQFRSVASGADAWWLVPGRATPLVGSNLEQVRVAARSGARLNTVAADLALSIDEGRLRRPDGGIALRVLAGMSRPVDRAINELDRAQSAIDSSASPWVLGPVAGRMRVFRTELDRTRRSADTACLAVQRVPDLLGGSGPRRYLLLLGNPAELRDLGGHLGNWAEIVVDDGTLRLVEVGMPYDLFSPNTSPAPTLTPGAYPQSLVEMRPQYFPQNWGATPDLDTVARLAAELYPQARPGAPLDGVMYADPAAFAALLQITGPVAVPGLGVTLTATNAVDFLTRDQFALLPEGSKVLDDVIRTTLNAFTSKQLPSPRRLAQVLAPAVTAGRLRFASLNPADRPLLNALGLTRPVTRRGADDLLAVTNRNANPNKIDAYLSRTITYDVRWNPTTGRVRSVVTVRLTNSLPAGNLPQVVIQDPGGVPPGTNRTQLSILSALGARSATIDGAVAGIGTQQEYRGVQRHSVLVDVPPNQTRVITMELDGDVAPDRYVLDWFGQPLVSADRVTVIVRPDGPNLPPGTRPVGRTFRGDRTRTLVVPGPVG